MNTKTRQMMDKIQLWLCGQPNDKIEHFFHDDEKAYDTLIVLLNECVKAGWDDPKKSMANYANADLAEVIYERAVGVNK